MTQYFEDNGIAHAATVVAVGPGVVTQVKTQETDGYDAIQVGFGTRDERHVAKPQRGHFGDRGLFRYVREVRLSPDQVVSYNVGDTIPVNSFAAGDALEVSGISKGKGFQGVVKRHGFAGGRRSHGQKHSEREAGAIGGSGGRAGGRVAKGIRMAGRMGTDRVTVKNLRILAVDEKANLVLVKGAIPGRRGTMIELVG